MACAAVDAGGPGARQYPAILGAIAFLAVLIANLQGAPASAQDAFTAYSQAVLNDFPVAYYRLDETSGTLAQDSSSAGYNATYVGAVSLNSPGVFPSDAAVGVLGDSGYVSTSNQPTPLPTLTGASDRSVELWFKTAETGNLNIFHAGAFSHTNDFSLGVVAPGGPGGCGNPGLAGFYFRGWDDDLLFGGLNLADGRWHYLAITFPTVGPR